MIIMKTCYRIAFASLVALLALASCRKENGQVVEWKTELQAVKSDLVFTPNGGTETLEVNLSSVTATADKDWCSVSVSGNVISVTVTANESKQSRYAQLTITSGSESIGAAVIQTGEIISGLDLKDLEVLPEGTTVRYSYESNVPVVVNSDQPWVHLEKDEEAGVVTLIVDEHKDFGYRFATVTYKAGSKTGSIQVLQEPAYREISGWSAAVTDGEFVSPDQTDVITVTPPEGMASVTYAWDVASEFYTDGTDNVPEAIRTWATRAKNYPSFFIFDKGVSSKTKKNLPSTVTVAIICFDDQKYPTGQYALVDVSVPDRSVQQ
jgi:hypothetical protein